MSDKRTSLLSALEDARGSRLLVYFTGDRRGLETIVHSEVLDLFTQHLDAMADVRKISLFLYTRGGDTLAAWSIANLLRQFCEELEIIVPSKAQSAGTLMCLAADRIIMTKQATLGPIDPSVAAPLGPPRPGAPAVGHMPVSVEDVSGYVEFARSVSDSPGNLSQALAILANSVPPLVLGKAFRARSQIRMLAAKLMGDRFGDQERIEKILGLLCSESGSHDYTINRREARDELGLPIEKPSVAEYQMIKALYEDIATELELTTPFNPDSVLGLAPTVRYSFQRAIIQSVSGGSHTFTSEGTLTRQQIQTPAGPQIGILDQRSFEGWRFANA